MEPNKYENTISDSKQESILKAVDILFRELDSAPKAEVSRPTINYRRLSLCFIAWLCPIILACFLPVFFPVLHPYRIWIAIAVGLLTTVILLKRIVIYLVLLYQRFAPARIRASCVFEPTCSNYMLLAIEKYGVFRGVWRGVRRLFRCHYPNGGVDYP